MLIFSLKSIGSQIPVEFFSLTIWSILLEHSSSSYVANNITFINVLGELGHFSKLQVKNFIPFI